ncbi:hypothetical protein EVAR_25840_1 [Eumeta japonica]|uniref:Uncharacterized protein n=1 Tax=Eumeta variegata TaxID=151549 RepID=A0A4C1VU27_EUMVA|nr:hypothetical protein EVAR_25840_1 [Eumeta japonica]
MRAHCVRIPTRRRGSGELAEPRVVCAATNNRRLINTCNSTATAIKRARTIPRFWAGGSGPKTPITLELIQQVPTKALSDIGYEAPQDVVKN